MSQPVPEKDNAENAINTTEAYGFSGRTVVDQDSEKIGTIEEIYTDVDGGQPEWALVHSGLFGTKETFVPLRGATPTGEDLRLPISKDQAKSSPQIETDSELSEEDEAQLFEHYGVPYTTEGATTAEGPGLSATGIVGDTGEAMTRSEEELHVGTERRERSRVRLRKYVVTEEVQTTVPVRREEVRLEREPITDANVDDAVAGAEISEAEHGIVLHEEVPVVEKRSARTGELGHRHRRGRTRDLRGGSQGTNRNRRGHPASLTPLSSGAEALTHAVDGSHARTGVITR